VLDEPTSGLDPLMESVFQDCIIEAAAEGRTVLLSSHILAEVERLCDRVTIIRQGRAVQHGTLEELRYLTRTSITVATDRPLVGLDVARRACTTSRWMSGMCTSTSTAVRSTERSAMCPPSASTRWSADRPRSRNCSFATTATIWPTGRAAGRRGTDHDERPRPRRCAPFAGARSADTAGRPARQGTHRCAGWSASSGCWSSAPSSIEGLYSTPAEFLQYGRW
jgi:hypothetical protein